MAAADDYSFFDLVQIKKVRDLCAQRVASRRDPTIIGSHAKAGFRHGESLAGSGDLSRAGVAWPSGTRGGWWSRSLGSSCSNFSAEENRVLSRPQRNGPELVVTDVADLFARGIVQEENPSSQGEAITSYQRVLAMDPGHAAAHINLGTLYYNRQEYGLAERHYRAAIQIDPRYALAYFDLGNVLDETGRVEDAINTYKTAIQLAPTYADAHYNIALAYEKIREPRKALQHWRTYIKLDTTGPWTVHAKHQIQRILQSDSLKLVHSRKAN